MTDQCTPSRADRFATAPEDGRLFDLQADILRALAHPARLQILQLLREGERCVCEIEPVLGLRQPNISQHLAILRAADLVATRRDGLRIMYRVIDPTLFEVIDLVTGMVRRRGAGIMEAVARDGALPTV